MKRAKCPCCGAEVRSNEKTEAWARRWRCEPCGAPGTVSYDSQRRQARGAPGAAALEGGREASRASHRPRAPGRATPGRLVGGALFAAVPVPGGLLVGLLARREPDSGWGSPFLPCRPMTISTRSTGPARHHPSAGATGPYGGAESQKYVSPLATLKSTLCVL